ncbi:MAG: hypothetical protein H6929_20040 [Rhodoferax sp.]|nr:hypothetical protein [Rhodoferax sp.]
MNAKERLQVVQSALQHRGVHDVKFCFAKGMKETSADEVMTSVADFLEAYERGERAELTEIGGMALRA